MCDPDTPVVRITEGPGREEIVPLRDGAAMPAYLALPGGATGPGVLVIGDMYGRSPFYENVARRVAGLGYVALCPEPFHRAGPLRRRDLGLAVARHETSDEMQMLDDLSTALDWLQHRPEVTAGRMGVIGFCMGGTLALNLAAERDDLAICCFHGFPAGSGRAAVPAPAPLELVDGMHGPVIGFWGERDAESGRDNVRRFLDALRSRGVDFHAITYPNVEHGFMTGDLDDDRTRDAFCHAWARMSAFLRRNLAEVGGSGAAVESVPAA